MSGMHNAGSRESRGRWRVPVGAGATAKPAPRKPAPPPEILDEEPVEDVLEDVEEKVEAQPKKKGKGAVQPASSSDATESERSMASYIHLGTLINILFAPFGYVLPLVLWVMKRKESAFIDHHGKTWLNFHLSMFVLSLGLVGVGGGLALGLSFVKGWLGLILGVLLGIALFALSVYMLIMYVVAGMKAKKGEWFEYRCLFRLFK